MGPQKPPGRTAQTKFPTAEETTVGPFCWICGQNHLPWVPGCQFSMKTTEKSSKYI